MRKLAVAAVGLGVAGMVWAVRASSSLYFNGALASSNVIEQNGVAYVPLKDVATAMHLNVAKTSRGYELTAAGGTGQIEGLNGKVGDVLWNGYLRFQVVKVIRGKTYTNQFSGDKMEITPNGEANDLVVIVCRIKSGLKTTESFALPAGDNTALTDTDEHSFPFRNSVTSDIPGRGMNLLPGAALDFALTFDVPENAKLKDLVYEPYVYGVAKAKDKKFRISLQ